MADIDRGRKTVLVLDTDDGALGRVAETLFAATAAKFGLGWKAVARRLGTAADAKARKATVAAVAAAVRGRGSVPTGLALPPAEVAAGDVAAAGLVVLLDEPGQRALFAERFPGDLGRVEAWPLGSGADAAPALERETSVLIARLFGGSRGDDAPSLVAEPAKPALGKKGAVVRIGRETKGRRGKGVTIVSDLPLDEAALLEFAAVLKGKCGSGGTAKEGRIEIQGDHRDRLAVELEKLGYRVKRVGG